MTTMTPSPSHPRQRVSLSPTGKDGLLISGNINTTASKSNGTKSSDRKDQHQQHHSISPRENYSPKRGSQIRSQYHWHMMLCRERVAILLLFTLTIFSVVHLLMRTVPIFYGVANILLAIAPSRSLAMQIDRNVIQKHSVDQLNEGDNPNPRIVWLMSFPNSGTSFIIHMTREATNCTTATNYGLEGEIRDVPSIQAIQGSSGVNGPWLELLRSKTTRIADTILTKTHCKGFCSGSFCGAERTFHTSRSFMMGCLTGNQGVLSSRGLRLTDKTYDRSLVKKAIHIFRHPLDNIVARFHLEYNEKQDAGITKYAKTFPKTALGFRRWCYLDDQNRGLVRSRFVDPRLRDAMLQIPCFNEFYRYTQWHNLAFETTRTMNLPTMVLHYHEFSDNFTMARNRIVDFLDLPLVGEGIDFDDGKFYSDYYTSNEKLAIRNFLEEFASAETWEQLNGYNFGNITMVNEPTNAI